MGGGEIVVNGGGTLGSAPGPIEGLGTPFPAATAPFGHRAQGLWHTTKCGNTAANKVVFETGPNGEVFAGAVKRLSMAKMRKHILSQIRSSPKRRR